MIAAAARAAQFRAPTYPPSSSGVSRGSTESGSSDSVNSGQVESVEAAVDARDKPEHDDLAVPTPFT